MATAETSEQQPKSVATQQKQQRFKLSLQQKNWVLAFHVGFAALWTGTVLSMFLIVLKNNHTTNADILFALNSVINLLDDFIVIPAAIGSVITATILCWQTNYGFFKFYWVITKWILTIGLIIFGTFWLFPWSNTVQAIAQSEGLGAFNNSIYKFDTKGILIGGIVQIVLLFVIIVISTLKPWGRRFTRIRS